jgi:hypothetical protein
VVSWTTIEVCPPYSKAPGTGAHAMGCHNSILSHSLGSVARPITQALMERDHETVALPYRPESGCHLVAPFP